MTERISKRFARMATQGLARFTLSRSLAIAALPCLTGILPWARADDAPVPIEVPIPAQPPTAEAGSQPLEAPRAETKLDARVAPEGEQEAAAISDPKTEVEALPDVKIIPAPMPAPTTADLEPVTEIIAPAEFKDETTDNLETKRPAAVPAVEPKFDAPAVEGNSDGQPAIIVTDEQLGAAQTKARQTEVDYLNAQIEIEQLRSKRRLAELRAQLAVAEASLSQATAPTEVTEGFIQNWLVLGPIHLDEKVSRHDEESCKQFLDRQYVATATTPKDGEKVTIDGIELSWTSSAANGYSVELSKIAETAGKDAAHAAYLGVVYITSEADQTGITLAVGSDDDSVWRLNGQEVIRAYEGRGIDKDQDTAEDLKLKKGVNVLSFTVLNGEGPAAAAARFLDEDGMPIKGLKFSTTPPANQAAPASGTAKVDETPQG